MGFGVVKPFSSCFRYLLCGAKHGRDTCLAIVLDLDKFVDHAEGPRVGGCRQRRSRSRCIGFESSRGAKHYLRFRKARKSCSVPFGHALNVEVRDGRIPLMCCSKTATRRESLVEVNLALPAPYGRMIAKVSVVRKDLLRATYWQTTLLSAPAGQCLARQFTSS